MSARCDVAVTSLQYKAIYRWRTTLAQSKASFIIDRFQPKLHCLRASSVSARYDVSAISLQCKARQRGETAMSAKKIAFMIRRFQSNLHRLLRMRGEWQVSHISAIKGEKHTKNYFGLQEKCPTLFTDFNQTCNVCNTRVGNARCDVSNNPQQCESR
jgi:hypothetical protein